MHGTSSKPGDSALALQAMEKAWDEATETDLVQNYGNPLVPARYADYTHSLKPWKKPSAAQNVKLLSQKQS